MTCVSYAVNDLVESSGCECCAQLSSSVNMQHYRLVCVHSPCQESDDAAVYVSDCGVSA